MPRVRVVDGESGRDEVPGVDGNQRPRNYVARIRGALLLGTPALVERFDIEPFSDFSAK